MSSGQEQVEVRVEQAEVGADGAVDRPAPSMFVWRGRLYVVRSVLHRWSTQAGRWRHVASEAAAAREGHDVGEAAVALADGPEETVWRVDASPGRGLGCATYDLIQHPATSSRGETWTLLRVGD